MSALDLLACGLLGFAGLSLALLAWQLYFLGREVKRRSIGKEKT